MTFQDAMMKSLRANSDRVAIEDERRKITYAELLIISNKITEFLLMKGLEGAVIGIQTRDRADLICAMLGIVNARCVFVAVDADLPSDRLTSMLKDLNLRHLISSRQLSQSTTEGASVEWTFFIEDILVENTADRVYPDLYPAYDENDSVYIYFTSGSTGKPKGILGQNKSLLQFLEWEIEAFQLGKGFRFSQFISPYFDAFLRDVLTPLLSGGTICLPPAGPDLFSPDRITSWLDKAGVNIIHCVPSLFRIINNDSLSTANYENLKYVLLSGEKIIPSQLEAWYDTFGGRIQLVNLYGPTETTMVRSFYEIRAADVRLTRIPIGTPIPDTRFLIAGKDLKPCDPLVSGEIYIITGYATKGYLNDPELTHEKFIKLYSGTPDETLAYKTGDIARVLANGKIDLIGREDRQVKLNGIRIEIDEIESVLVASGYVKNVVVISHSENDNDSLVAFLVRKENIAEDIDLTSAAGLYISRRLPKYMVPSAIVEVKSFPMLSNGKININELINILNAREIIAPINETEAKLLAIWKEILGNKPLSTEDLFLKAGGNSLAIMKLIGRIYKEFNVRIPLNELFRNLTIKGQAEFVINADRSRLYKIPGLENKPYYRLASQQEKIYWEYYGNGPDITGNRTMAFEIAGKSGMDKVKAVLNMLTQRHEILRTEFEVHREIVFQVVKKAVDLEVQIIEVEEKDIHQAAGEFIRPFDVVNGPLIRCGMLHTTNGRKILIFDISNIFCDEISQRQIYSDFVKFYSGEEVMALSLQYRDYAEWEYNFRLSDEYLSQREFWLKDFEKKVPVLNLMVTGGGGVANGVSDEMGGIDFSIDKSHTESLIRFLKNDTIPLSSVLFSIFLIYLYQRTRQDDIITGLHTSGRTQLELEGLVGPFERVLPIRWKIDPGNDFKKLVTDLHKYLETAKSKQFFNLEDIRQELSKKLNISPVNLFDAMFHFRESAPEAPDGSTLLLPSFYSQTYSSEYPFIFSIYEGRHIFDCKIQYKRKCFPAVDVELFAVEFSLLVENISSNPEIPISQLLDVPVLS